MSKLSFLFAHGHWPPKQLVIQTLVFKRPTVYACYQNRTESLIIARAIGFHRLHALARSILFCIYACLLNSPALIAGHCQQLCKWMFTLLSAKWKSNENTKWPNTVIVTNETILSRWPNLFLNLFTSFVTFAFRWMRHKCDWIRTNVLCKFHFCMWNIAKIMTILTHAISKCIAKCDSFKKRIFLQFHSKSLLTKRSIVSTMKSDIKNLLIFASHQNAE